MDGAPQSYWPFKPLIVMGLPPSANNIYVNVRGRGRFLHKDAKKFQHEMVDQAVRDLEFQSAIDRLDRGLPYEVHYRFFFPLSQLMTKHYGEKNGAKSRYQKMDVENRLKLVSDTFSTLIGIDDSQFFFGRHDKLCDRLVGGKPQIHIWFRPVDLEMIGI